MSKYLLFNKIKNMYLHVTFIFHTIAE